MRKVKFVKGVTGKILKTFRLSKDRILVLKIDNLDGRRGIDARIFLRGSHGEYFPTPEGTWGTIGKTDHIDTIIDAFAQVR